MFGEGELSLTQRCYPRKMAAIFASLMTDVLGYETYIAQGGDWGGAISSWLGFEHPSCKAIHINIMTMRHIDGPKGKDEINWAKRFEQDQISSSSCFKARS